MYFDAPSESAPMSTILDVQCYERLFAKIPFTMNRRNNSRCSFKSCLNKLGPPSQVFRVVGSNVVIAKSRN